MSGFTVASNEHLIRSNIWSRDIKEVLEEELFAQQYIRMITDFPDGDTINIPSIGAMESTDYSEDTPVQYTRMDTGNFTFTIDQYKSSATYITEKMKQDSFYMNELVSSFVPKQSRALMEAMEAKVLSVGPDGQTADSDNDINGAEHRWVGSGTNAVITVQDFAKAKYALRKANVPMTNLVAIVDPSVEYELSTLSQLTTLANNPMWEGIVRDGIATGMRFVANVYGFDVYTSNYLKNDVADSALLEKDGTTANDFSVNNGVANLFFSADAGSNPFVGAWRQMPEVDYEYNKDYQRHEYVTTARYGVKKYRPEGIVTIVSNPEV